ncbi:hypothetical protein RUND412_003301 [Rhizina undulata]
MSGSPSPSIDHRRVDSQGGHRRILRAVERAKAQFLQKTKPLSTRNGDDGMTGSYFDYLPTELVVDIFSGTDWRDLLQCRLVSRAFKELIDTHEHVIVSRILSFGTYLGLLAHLFHPPKFAHGAERKPTIHYVCLLENRHITCSQLAYYLCDKALSPMFEKPTTSSTGSRFDRTLWKERKEQDARKEQAPANKGTTGTLKVLHFLTHTRLRMEAAQAILAAENSDEHSLSPSELSRTYFDIQSSIIASFDNATLIASHHAMHFLVNSMRLYMSPEPPHTQNDEMIVLMLRCSTSLRRCVEFFAADSPSAPRTLRKQFMLDMQVERDESEARSGKTATNNIRRHSSVYGRSTKERERAERKVWTPKIGEVWFEAAKKALVDRGLKEHRQDGVYFFPDCTSELIVGCPDCYPTTAQ